jgi:putative membrane protein
VTWAELHPALNAVLNASAAVCLAIGWRAIVGRDLARHRAAMLSAIACSGVFLVSYVIRFLTTGAHRYPGEGWDRTLYLAILASHTLLALVALPLVLRTAYLALTSQLPRHRRIARWTLPIWAYVSFTGVVVYLMLYHLAPALHPGG